MINGPGDRKSVQVRPGKEHLLLDLFLHQSCQRRIHLLSIDNGALWFLHTQPESGCEISCCLWTDECFTKTDLRRELKVIDCF